MVEQPIFHGIRAHRGVQLAPHPVREPLYLRSTDPQVREGLAPELQRRLELRLDRLVYSQVTQLFELIHVRRPRHDVYLGVYVLDAIYR